MIKISFHYQRPSLTEVIVTFYALVCILVQHVELRSSASSLISTVPDSVTKVFTISDFKTQKLLQKYSDNYFNSNARLLVLPHFQSIYILVNESVILQLNQQNLQLIDNYKLPDMRTQLCPGGVKSTDCNEVKYFSWFNKISISEKEFPFFCYSYDSLYLNNLVKTTDSQKGCFVPQSDLHEAPYLKGSHLTMESYLDGTTPGTAFLSSSSGYTYLAGFDNRKPRIMRFSTPSIHGGESASSKLTYLKSKAVDDSVFSKPVNFLMVFETDNAVYFLYRESFLPTSCLKPTHSTVTRLARVCKNDPGGFRDLNEADIFGTFSKATLNCQWNRKDTNNENDAEFNEVIYDFTWAMDAVWNENEKVLAVLYHAKWFRGSASAVCLYSLEQIEKAFNSGASVDNTTINNPLPDVCSNLKSAKESLISEMKLFLMKHPLRLEKIEPLTDQPILIGDDSLWQKILWNPTPRAQNDLINNSVIYLLSPDRNAINGFHIQIPSNSSYVPTICTYHNYRMDVNETIYDMKINTLEEEPHLLLVTERRVLQFPLFHCEWNNQQFCLSDPYCRQGEKSNDCKLVRPTLNKKWESYQPRQCSQQNIVLNKEIEMWNRWRREDDWFSCSFTSLKENVTQKCWCRMNSQGDTFTKNCVVDGEWSSWTSWSRCSLGCNSGIRERTRECDSPPASYGGRNCRGPKKQTQTCSSGMNICPASQGTDQWSNWSSWTPCSSSCGEGEQRRWRKCLSDSAADDCSGQDTDIKICHGNKCPSDMEEISQWSPWLLESALSDKRDYIRAAFTCQRLHSQMKLQRRTCTRESTSCTFPETLTPRESWSQWSSWSRCNVTCGNGIQQRERWCNSEQQWCTASAVQIRPCHEPPCHPAALNRDWSSWSEWTSCTVTCGDYGIQTRHRQCRSTRCIGSGIQQQLCHQGPCVTSFGIDKSTSDWSVWSVWSTCRSGFQTRQRQCVLCNGEAQQYKSCVRSSSTENSSTNEHRVTYLHLIVGAGSSMLSASLLTILVICHCHSCRTQQPPSHHPLRSIVDLTRRSSSDDDPPSLLRDGYLPPPPPPPHHHHHRNPPPPLPYSPYDVISLQPITILQQQQQQTVT